MVRQRFRGALVAAGVPGGNIRLAVTNVTESVRISVPYGSPSRTASRSAWRTTDSAEPRMATNEVASITAIMLHGENNPTLTRDTLFAVVMIILNGMVGLALLLGGLRHREQDYNLQGANAYLGVILPLIAFSLLLPDFTQTTPGPTLSIGQSAFVAIVTVGLYVTFLALQTGRHRNYFTFEAGQLARPADYVIETMGAPDAVGGVAIAILVATPEAIGAVRAALANRVQRSINILLGSVLSTIGVTIPAMIATSPAIR
jgi:Ca2+:H+ antiporter